METGAFNGSMIHYVYFDGCKALSSFDPGVFKGSNLLGLSGSPSINLYRMPALSALTRGMFEGLSTKVGITVTDCEHLTRIDAGAFSGFISSSGYVFFEITISGNPIKHISPLAFEGEAAKAPYGRTKIITTYLDCCGAEALMHSLPRVLNRKYLYNQRAYNAAGFSALVCASPHDLRGRDLLVDVAHGGLYTAADRITEFCPPAPPPLTTTTTSPSSGHFVGNGVNGNLVLDAASGGTVSVCELPLVDTLRTLAGRLLNATPSGPGSLFETLVASQCAGPDVALQSISTNAEPDTHFVGNEMDGALALRAALGKQILADDVDVTTALAALITATNALSKSSPASVASAVAAAAANRQHNLGPSLWPCGAGSALDVLRALATTLPDSTIPARQLTNSSALRQACASNYPTPDFVHHRVGNDYAGNLVIEPAGPGHRVVMGGQVKKNTTTGPYFAAEVFDTIAAVAALTEAARAATDALPIATKCAPRDGGVYLVHQYRNLNFSRIETECLSGTRVRVTGRLATWNFDGAGYDTDVDGSSPKKFMMLGCAAPLFMKYARLDIKDAILKPYENPAAQHTTLYVYKDYAAHPGLGRRDLSHKVLLLNATWDLPLDNDCCSYCA